MKNILKSLGIAILIVALFWTGTAKAEDPLTGAALLYGHTGSAWKKVAVDSNGNIVTISNSNKATEIYKTIDFTESQTAQALWTPAAGKKFVITDVIVSASAAGAITVFDGTDNTTLRVFKVNLPANGGMSHPYETHRVSAAADNVLKYTTGAGIAGSITVSGYEI